ncbi:exodeoxyribonuclease VII large subunit [Caproicibacterium lactatifermentans]|jgi:exodeoxyribonuclease VII large subunit|uniref:Exodeoxyribonuclease 7 large subunit n=1 Tax=Caproicibacterium lactatifermentans TaxID=2666138 RepID=A0A859DRA8_9FIRM|nr:exodeoxyribonuclease VII large subunit [Caproicibacterium lactatifermentans]ARP50104.1 exodeoxyribonuclease VII large subunit [Ruminococcaceae bacterium CPB6]MDD4808293.1 exodeoxyribonuclease VII large subunit [Oscillospiraceae bacterium]QKN24174.1 exodeoxyribonuclease VII large subunit [Caproicibacterium lactatifermentans]QKO30757.1 exodeoxyribonuclease VII large subunit [Caproicibacterium lactatifermentans]
MIPSCVLTVTQINLYVKSLLEGDEKLHCVYVTGEISNFTDHYRSGHLYFSLKDEKCAVKAVMFASSARRLRFHPQNGIKVLVRGRISSYEVSGQYQLYVEEMQPVGAGERALAYEQLKEKLRREGLFDAERKKELPRYPTKIGVITSPTGAVIHDIQNVTARRWPLAEILLYPVAVQGEGAAPQLVQALQYFSSRSCADVLIIGRGGGSAEDLWAFNEEAVVRAVAACPLPVISAVGHETDVTLTDFAADLRAPTPSAAAELAVPDGEKLKNALLQTAVSMHMGLENRLNDERMQLDLLSQSLQEALEKPTQLRQQELGVLAGRLEDLNPLRVLRRGYSVVTSIDGQVLMSPEKIHTGEQVQVRMDQGTLLCTVDKKENLHESENDI